jgi:hypothetical protein
VGLVCILFDIKQWSSSLIFFPFHREFWSDFHEIFSLSKPMITFSPSKSPSKSPSSSPVSEGYFPNARKIKVQSLTGVLIQMFELQVISTGVNVAIDKDTTLSHLISRAKQCLLLPKPLMTMRTASRTLAAVSVASGGRSIWKTRSLLNPSRF